MVQTLKNIPLKFKLITCFLLIISINAISGLMSLRIMEQLGELVNVTYDKALMSGTFAQAVKFNFSQHDLEIRSALMAEDADDYRKHLLKSKKAYSTLKEDLLVVEERSLSPKSAGLIQEINLQLIEIQKLSAEVLSKKEALLANKNSSMEAFELEKSWEDNRAKSGLYRKLTALYDESAEVGYHFRLSSEEKNKKNFTRTVIILFSCIGISLILSIIVSYLIISPLFKLRTVTNKVGEGDYSVRAEVTSKDELGSLAFSFNHMLDTIQEKSENISSLLSSLPFGLFYFDEKGTISKERSQSTDILFKNFSQYKDLKDFFGDHHCSTKQTADILKAVFQGLLPFNSAVFLFPDMIKAGTPENERTIQLSYKPKYGPKKKLEKVILLAEDITEKIRAQDESRVLTERVDRVSKVSTDIAGFKEFLPAVREYYLSIERLLDGDPVANLTELKRELHSLKGMLGIYSFKACASEVHELESVISEGILGKIPECIERATISRGLFEEQAEDITLLLALNNDSGLKYYDVNKINIIRNIAEVEHNHRLIQAILDLDKFPIHKVFAKYSNYAQAIAEKLEDKKVRIVFLPSDEVSYEEVQRLDSVLVHVLNNSIDHGIESRYERTELHKDEVGEIRISCLRNKDQSLEFKISDDGKGINGEYLLEKAVKMGIIPVSRLNDVTEDEKINLIFASGLSTKDESSEVSGRGIGMDAVKTYLESLGGSIKLYTELGVGTTFSLKVPALDLIHN
jgi:signal transduction histidine kinase/HAMP domain-containing protein